MNIKRVSNVILAVKNLENSLKFYHEILGMPIKNQRDNWVDLGQSGGSFLSLHPATDDEPHTGTSIHNGVLVGLIVGDIESAVTELKSKDVRVHREIQKKDAGKNAIVIDPDDYLISLFEPDLSKEKDQQTAGYVGFTPA